MSTKFGWGDAKQHRRRKGFFGSTNRYCRSPPDGAWGGSMGGHHHLPESFRRCAERRAHPHPPRAHSTSFFYAACTALVAGARPTPRAAHSTPCQAHYYNMALNERLLSGEEPLRSRSCVAPVAIASAGLIALTLTVLTASSRAYILNMEGSSTTQRHHVHEIALVNFIRHGERNQNPADTGLTAGCLPGSMHRVSQ